MTSNDQVRFLEEEDMATCASLLDQVKLMAELVNQTLCTQEDLEKSEERLTLKIESVRKEVKVEMESVRKELALHIIQVKHEMVKWLIGMSIASLGLIFTMFKFLV